MIRRPPRSPLSPSTTLSGSGRTPARVRPHRSRASRARPAMPERLSTRRPHGDDRSEEHTSELQSRQYLVCRLLLEKKKHSKYSFPTSYVAYCLPTNLRSVTH